MRYKVKNKLVCVEQVVQLLTSGKEVYLSDEKPSDSRLSRNFLKIGPELQEAHFRTYGYLMYYLGTPLNIIVQDEI